MEETYKNAQAGKEEEDQELLNELVVLSYLYANGTSSQRMRIMKFAEDIEKES